MMGEIAARWSDLVVATSDNPRTEDPLQILDEIEPGLKRGPAPYRLEADRRKAIRMALELAGKGDVVILAGKGHENYQEIKGVRYPFSDSEIAHRALSMWSTEERRQ